MRDFADNLLGLTERSAIVWGGGGGMGEDMAQLLADAGVDVAVIDIDPAQADRVAAEIRSKGRQAIGIGADVTKAEQVDAAVAAAREAIGCPTLSACVVGVASWSPLSEMDDAKWARDHDLNLSPMFFIGRALSRLLATEGKAGALVFVSSISGLEAAISHGSYGAAKAGMMALACTMAVEWAPLGLRVNCVAPGPIETKRISASPQMLDLLARRVPLGRFGRTGEIASACLFLLSDMASYVTGQTLVVDGGWMAAPLINPHDNPKLPG